MKYYKTDSRKISFREYWHISPKGFWVAWLNKIRGIQMNFSRGMAEPQPLKTRMIESASIPREILEKLNSEVGDLQKIGFTQFWYWSNKHSLTGGVGYAAIGLHPSGQILAKVIYVYLKTRERQVIALVSGFADGTTLSTTNKKREFNPPPRHTVQRKVGAGAEQLFKMHQQKLAESSRTEKVLTLAGLDDMAAFEDKFIQQGYDDKIKRGIWVEMSDAEVAALRARPAKAYMILPR